MTFYVAHLKATKYILTGTGALCVYDNYFEESCQDINIIKFYFNVLISLSEQKLVCSYLALDEEIKSLSFPNQNIERISAKALTLVI